MPNPVGRKFTVQLGPTFTPDTAGELAAWAELRGKSVSEVTREAAEHGLNLLRREWAAETGRRPVPARLAELTAEAAERGEKQATRRRNYDRSVRAANAAGSAG